MKICYVNILKKHAMFAKMKVKQWKICCDSLEKSNRTNLTEVFGEVENCRMTCMITDRGGFVNNIVTVFELLSLNL